MGETLKGICQGPCTVHFSTCTFREL